MTKLLSGIPFAASVEGGRKHTRSAGAHGGPGLEDETKVKNHRDAEFFIIRSFISIVGTDRWGR